MKRTLNPKDPIRNEVTNKDRPSPSSEFNAHPFTQGYEYTNYPDAIPEECFVFFGNKTDNAAQLT